MVEDIASQKYFKGDNSWEIIINAGWGGCIPCDLTHSSSYIPESVTICLQYYLTCITYKTQSPV